MVTADLEAVLEYHRLTQHRPNRYAPGPGYLDWDNQPEPFRRFADALSTVPPEAWRQQREREAWRLMDRGVPEDIARRHVVQPFLVHGPNVVAVAAETGRPIEDVGVSGTPQSA